MVVKKRWLAVFAAGMLLIGAIIFVPLVLKSEKNALLFEKEYARLNNYLFNAQADEYIKSGETPEDARGMVAYIMVRFDPDPVKEKVIACYKTHTAEAYAECGSILLNKMNEEIDIITTQDIPLKDVSLAGIIYSLPEEILPTLQERFYKTEDIVDILVISLVRFNPYEQFGIMQKCFNDSPQKTREDILSCFDNLKKRYQKVVEEVIVDYKIQPAKEKEIKSAELNSEMLFAKIHNYAIALLIRVNQVNGMDEQSAKFKSAFVLSQLDLAGLRQQTLNCLKENEIIGGKISNAQTLQKKCGKFYVLKVIARADLPMDNESAQSEALLAHGLDKYMEEGLNKLQKSGYNKTDAEAVIAIVHGKLDINKCVRDGMVCFGDENSNKSIQDCLMPCYNEVDKLIDLVIKDYQIQPAL